MQRPLVSIIIPTYNEEENVDPLLARILAVKDLQDLKPEIVFSDGASTDNTRKKVEEWMRTHNVRLVSSETNEGLSAAVMAGARMATGEFVVVMDADLSHPPESIPAMLAPLFEGKADMTIGSRYVTGGSTPEWPLSRKISSKVATLPARMLTDVKDPLAGFLAVRRRRLADMNRKVCGFKIGLELLATSEKELRVKEVPITFRDRCFGSSKMSPQVVYDYLRQLLILAGVDLMPWPATALLPLLAFLAMVDGALLRLLQYNDVSVLMAHCYSYLTATALGGITLMIWILRQQSTLWKARYLEWGFGGIWVSLLVLMLRGGLVVSLLNGGELTGVDILAVSVFSIGCGYFGSVFYVFSIGRKRIRDDLVERFYAVGAFIYLLVLRWVYLPAVPALPEELWLQQSVSHLPYLAPFLGAEGEISLLTIRAANWLIWLFSLVCVFNLARVMVDRSTAFMTCLLYGVLPYFFGAGLFVSEDGVLILFWACALHMLFRMLVNKVDRGWLWAGLILGFGMQADIRMLAILVAAVLYLLGNEVDRQRLLTPMPYLALGVLALTTIPSILFPEFFPGTGRLPTPWLQSLLPAGMASSALAVTILLSPTGLLAGCAVLLRWLRVTPVKPGKRREDWQRGRRFTVLMFFVPFLLFLLPGLYPGGPVLAGSAAWLVLLPAMALTISRKGIALGGSAALLRLVWWPTIGVLMVGYGIALQMMSLC